MGELLGSPRVAPLLSSFQPVYELFSRPTTLLLRALAGFDRRRGVSGADRTRRGAGKRAGEGLNCAAAESGQARGARIK